MRQASVVQLQKRIAESDTKLKQQQSLYETVRSDRNLYSKNLNEAQVGPRSSRDQAEIAPRSLLEEPQRGAGRAEISSPEMSAETSRCVAAMRSRRDLGAISV